MDLAQAAGEPIPVEIAGRTYRVRPRPLGELGELMALYKRDVPSPTTKALEALEQASRRGSKPSEAVRRLALSVALREPWPPRLGSAAWLADADEAGLSPEVVRFALRPEHPDLALADARDLCDRAEGDELSWVAMALFYGRGKSDPKARGATMPPTTTPTPGSPDGSGTTGPGASITSPPPATGPTP